MNEFSTRQYVQSGVEVAVVAVKEIVHLTHCFGQLAVMYAKEQIDKADEQLARQTELPHVD